MESESPIHDVTIQLRQPLQKIQIGFVVLYSWRDALFGFLDNRLQLHFRRDLRDDLTVGKPATRTLATKLAVDSAAT